MQITLNGEKIWPLDNSWKSFSSGTKNVWDTSLHLEEGDQLVFAIGSNGDNGGDATFVQSSVAYTDEYYFGTSDYISDLEWTSAFSGDSGSNPVRRDLSCGNNTINLRQDGKNVSYTKGVGTHIDSTITLDLTGKNYSRFISDVGADAEIEPSEPDICPDVEFIVYGDGKELGRASNATYVSGIKTIDVDVTNAKELKLVAKTNLNQNYFGHVDWADARLVHASPDVLSITVDTQNRGTVTGLPSPIYANTSIALKAVPVKHYVFAGWKKAGETEYLSTDAEYTFTAAEDLALEAVFEGEPLTVTVKDPENGTITGLPKAVRYGDSITLTAAPAEHYHFAGWKKAGSTGYVSTEAEYTFTAEESCELEAVFEADTFTITVKDPQNGTVTGLPGTVHYGDTITLTATPAAHYHFAGWKKAGTTDYISTNATYTFTASENLTLEAVFEADTLTITVNTPQNGTVAGLPETVRYGDSITLTATPAAHYHFAVWQKAGTTDYISTNTTYTFTAEENLTLEAVFEADTLTITVKAPQNGTVTGLPETIHYGDSITLTATPAAHYHFAGWKKAGTTDYISTDTKLHLHRRRKSDY